MVGGFAINDWLAKNGFLTLVPGARGAFSADQVDWRRTSAWADGGYVGRIHFNVEGREPLGVVLPRDVDALADTIARTPAPVPLRFGKPRAMYRATNGFAPALQVEAAELTMRCLASVGHDQLISAANDGGPDDANHGRDGVVLSPQRLALGDAPDLYDVTPTVLAWLGLERPASLRGRGWVA
jgi:predicted AlkP superfamily phosphohydrolase/phosphomutase